MTGEAREAALAERERIARLASECGATYRVRFQEVSFADLIRSGATRPPWARTQVPDPLSAT